MNELAVQVEEVVVTVEQRELLVAYVAEHPGHGYARAMRAVGVAGTRGQLRAFLEDDTELRDALRDAAGDRLRTKLMDGALYGLPETVVTPSGQTVERMVQQPRLIEFAARIYLPEARVLRQGHVEHSGVDGGPIEVEVRHDYDDLLHRLERIGVVRRGEAGAADAAVDHGARRPELLPARPD